MHYGYPKIGVFGGFRGKNSKFYFSRPQKALPYAETRLSTAVPEFRNRKKEKKKYLGCTFHVYAGKNPFGRFLPKLAFYN